MSSIDNEGNIKYKKKLFIYLIFYNFFVEM